MKNCSSSGLTRSQCRASPGPRRWWAQVRHELQPYCEIRGRSSMTATPKVPLPSERRALVAVGMMVTYIMDVRSSNARLLDRALSTWVPHNSGDWINLMVIHHCPAHAIAGVKNRSIPLWVDASLAKTIWWRCFRPETRHNMRKLDNYRKLSVLHRLLASELPHRDLYLKIDADTLLVPASLLMLLSHLPRRHEHAAYYMGTIEATDLLAQTHADCTSQTWRRCNPHKDFCATEDEESGKGGSHGEGGRIGDHPGRADGAQCPRADSLASARLRRDGSWPRCPCGERAGAITFAQGGAEAMSWDSLRRLVESGCIEAVGRSVCYSPVCIHRAEDVALGICMRRLCVAHWQCSCFHPSPPCDAQAVNARSACAGRLCSWPISMHRLRTPAAYDAWWQLLGPEGERGART